MNKIFTEDGLLDLTNSIITKKIKLLRSYQLTLKKHLIV